MSNIEQIRQSVLFCYNVFMIDSAIHAKDFFLGNYDDCDKLNYNPDKPRLKEILWDNLDWIQHLYDIGKLRDTVLDNVVERHIKYTKKIKLNARRHNVKFRSIQII